MPATVPVVVGAASVPGRDEAAAASAETATCCVATVTEGATLARSVRFTAGEAAVAGKMTADSNGEATCCAIAAGVSNSATVVGSSDVATPCKNSLGSNSSITAPTLSKFRAALIALAPPSTLIHSRDYRGQSNMPVRAPTEHEEAHQRGRSTFPSLFEGRSLKQAQVR